MTMTFYCRLCAESKTADELSTTISDSKLNIKEKLVACCQWNHYSKNTHLPDGICYLCCDKLEKSWLFNESVANAQIKLHDIFHETELLSVKCELSADDDEFNVCDTAENIFVEPITLAVPETEPEPPLDDEKHLIGSTIEMSEENKSRQNHECETCQKTFTTAYNLTVCLYFDFVYDFKLKIC